MKAAESGVEITLASTVAVVLKRNEPSVGSAVSSVVTIAASADERALDDADEDRAEEDDAERPPPPAPDEPARAAERLPALQPSVSSTGTATAKQT